MNNRIRYTQEGIKRNLYYQMPKFLLEVEFIKLSNDARVLYSIMRDRHELSIKNKWVNENDEVYLIFSREKMCETLNLSRPTIIKIMKELKAHNLIEERRLGQGKPNQIYLLAVATDLTYEIPSKNLAENKTEKDLTLEITDESSDVKNNDLKTEKIFNCDCQNTLSDDVKNFYPINKELKETLYIENKPSQVKSSQVGGSTSTKNDLTGLPCNQINNQTHETFSNNEKELCRTLQATHASEGNKQSSNTKPFGNQYITYSEWESSIKYNIDYNSFIQAREPYIKLVDTIIHNIISIMIETSNIIILNKKDNITMRTADAKEICLRLQHEHIEYVLEKFKDISEPITHKSNYLKRIILSSITEIAAYYQNEYMQGNL